MDASPDLVDWLGARTGVVCAVGAGGKKSLLYALANHHGGRVALTATVHTASFPPGLAAVEIIDHEDALRDRVVAESRRGPVCYACPSTKPDRHAGVSSSTVRAIHDQAQFDVTLVKADGARMRWVKAPAKGEPVLAARADTVIAVVSARAIGEPLSDRIAHRLERVAAVTGLAVGEIVTPESVARLLASEDGALHGADDASVVPVINMVDSPQREALAREAARLALGLTHRFDRVVLTCLRRPSARVAALVER